ncbi:hypothetical protein LXA43DRAFT_99400 [Ganoderma leucocontextum]|nr:hypothetical protein LXA43DRAFT_99400 [Ganoderma leucocontextum]
MRRCHRARGPVLRRLPDDITPTQDWSSHPREFATEHSTVRRRRSALGSQPSPTQPRLRGLPVRGTCYGPNIHPTSRSQSHVYHRAPGRRVMAGPCAWIWYLRTSDNGRGHKYVRIQDRMTAEKYGRVFTTIPNSVLTTPATSFDGRPLPASRLLPPPCAVRFCVDAFSTPPTSRSVSPNRARPECHRRPRRHTLMRTFSDGASSHAGQHSNGDGRVAEDVPYTESNAGRDAGTRRFCARTQAQVSDPTRRQIGRSHALFRSPFCHTASPAEPRRSLLRPQQTEIGVARLSA